MKKPKVISDFLTKIRTDRWDRYYDKYKSFVRGKLKKDSVTIISQNCIGGVLYDLLGKRFDSPTINMYIYQSDFCKFCSDLHYYMTQDLEFYINEQDRHCPYAYLGEGDKRISIQFTHYKDETDAREAWERRKSRIHWDDLYIITNDGNGVTPEELVLLDEVPCKRKIVFTSRERPEIKDSFVLNSLKKEKTAVLMQASRDRWTGYRPWQKEFDCAAWFNGEDDFRLK